jgi:glycosyltransferase involved in cell wall biosynthesis
MSSDVEILRMGVKHMMMDVSSLRRELAALRDPGGPEPADDVQTFGPARPDPAVSVVVTLYNYEEYIAAAIESVARSDLREIELIVVDDRSRDNSAAVAQATLERHPWLTATLIRRGANKGLGPGRNLGLEHARGRHVFILDADNTIYPHALGRLSRALDENPEAAFAYGILEKFDGSGPIGLESFLEWDPGRLRYSNYIDAMAMLRRDAVVAVGGFVSDAAIYGWEDFALWCTFADAGYGGVRVPEIVARYRVGVSSMIALANVDDRETWSALLRRFRVLRPAEAA